MLSTPAISRPPCQRAVEGFDTVVKNAVVKNAVVKMKLNTFCDNHQLRSKLGATVLDMNQLIGEAYAFANYHVLRLLQKARDARVTVNTNVAIGVSDSVRLDVTPVMIPKIDRNFYYRCLLAVSVNKARATTLENDFVETRVLFDSLRDANVPKVSIRGHNQVVADLSISMATMATNHLWMNIEKRLRRYLTWSQPALKPAQRKRVIESILYKPTIGLEELFPNRDNVEQNAFAVARELRGQLQLSSNKQHACIAHMLLPLYFEILRKTEVAKEADAIRKNENAEHNNVKKFKRFGGRVFSMLPLKNSYTISYIQFSSMSILGYLKSLKLETFPGDGRYQDASCILGKYFNTKLVETANRKFGNRIITDGAGVSILMNKRSALICPNDCPCTGTLKILYANSLLERRNKDHVRVASVDPGLTDVVTSMDQYGNASSYSSAKYYEDALYNMSNRRTSGWNKDTKALTDLIQGQETSRMQKFEQYLGAYLTHLRPILNHRMNKGYRNMRFLRYQMKKKAIKDICDMVAPPDEFSVIGFGDWQGANGTPISRRCAGPLQEIKFELSSRSNVVMLSIDEFCTSKKCSVCSRDLVNMRASTTSYVRVEGVKTKRVEVKKVHKILHCGSRQAGTSPLETPSCGLTWDRDINASKNILTLTLLLMQGLPRPQALTRSKVAKIKRK